MKSCAYNTCTWSYCGDMMGDMRRVATSAYMVFFFFFQAEDGIRDYKVTGVQTCALPICEAQSDSFVRLDAYDELVGRHHLHRFAEEWKRRGFEMNRNLRDALRQALAREIGRASCRERV